MAAVQPQMMTPQPGQAVMMMPAGIVNAMYIPDQQRNPQHHPGRFIYSAQFDHEKLVCMYTCMTSPWSCGVDEMARETHYDVYSNAVTFARPDIYIHAPDCCFGRHTVGLTRYYDHPVFDAPLTAGGCWNCCGKYGDQLNHHLRCMNTCHPSGLAHAASYGCPESMEVVFGLKEGEAARVASIVNDQVRIFRANPYGYALDMNAQGASTQPLPKMA